MTMTTMMTRTMTKAKGMKVNAFGNCDSSSLPEVLGSVTATRRPKSAKEQTE